MIIYSEKVMEHFMSPQNAYSMPDANAQGIYGDPSCGDALIIFLKVQDNVIQEISYLVFGCCASIATSSMTSVLAKGKSLDDALNITEEDVIRALDGLPETKAHCSKLGVSALRNAINKKGIEVITGAKGHAKAAVEQYLQGTLKTTGSVCHEHQHHDECGH